MFVDVPWLSGGEEMEDFMPALVIPGVKIPNPLRSKRLGKLTKSAKSAVLQCKLKEAALESSWPALIIQPAKIRNQLQPGLPARKIIVMGKLSSANPEKERSSILAATILSVNLHCGTNRSMLVVKNAEIR